MREVLTDVLAKENPCLTPGRVRCSPRQRGGNGKGRTVRWNFPDV